MSVASHGYASRVEVGFGRAVKVRYGGLRQCNARLGVAVAARYGQVRNVESGLGWVRQSGLGLTCHVGERLGRAVSVRRVVSEFRDAWLGSLGMAFRAGPVSARLGASTRRQGQAWQSRLGRFGQGAVRSVRSWQSRLGAAGLGRVWPVSMTRGMAGGGSL